MARTREAGRWLDTSDGLRLAVREHGDPSAPTVLAVHGYPDDQAIWDGVADALAGRFRVVSYDVRGAGESDKPRRTGAYLLAQLADDLGRVADLVSPDRPVHLLAHDWGSIQAWHAVTEPRLAHRFASFTSISGPCLDHAGRWMREQLRHPTPRSLRKLVNQLIFSGYISFFQLPVLPELAWRTGAMRRLIATLERLDPRAAHNPTQPAVSDGVRGLALYRANMRGRLGDPGERRTDIPVQVLAPTGDPFVSAPMQTEIAQWVANLRIRRVPGGHWLPRSRPELVARCAAELVEHVEGGAESRGLRRSRVRPGRREFQDQLVVVTGAGSGIGRATAVEFAAAGAHVVVADIDEAAAQNTAALITRTGAGATPHRVDVADGAAVERFAEHVRAELGTPDVVVNNAGIGLAGAFLDTPDAEWERAIDINLWGVIHGCRQFARQMIDRGEGGRIVNIASAAAYLPSQLLPAYSTTKAAVLALSQSLRVELAAEGIGVVAVCPGLVNTGITTSTRFVGVDDAEQARLRQAAKRLYQRRNFTPQRAAAEILRATRRNTAIAPVTAEAKAGLVLSRLTPGLLRAAARADLTPR
ncbi:Short-chain dehydrogenase [Saccharopolyspora antimicrobica]|uniref:Short-chain dehydrogenase n=1 Tax=Saccharopolyspora antimicrobica TaxID=455193 RepID=A0A1I4R4X5_9PSEU|nr:SDR family oxidoreductase [Saccharopolyspora antimicrobica]RKT88176.1 short-subunit dehydrogenase [Saccharopolyspora antimicrobica]SFM47036.1 Short-chain dehydrogenase [Saccharopolyspora antimicrobica]